MTTKGRPCAATPGCCNTARNLRGPACCDRCAATKRNRYQPWRGNANWKGNRAERDSPEWLPTHLLAARGEEMTSTQVAVELGISRQGVEDTLRRALKKLRALGLDPDDF